MRNRTHDSSPAPLRPVRDGDFGPELAPYLNEFAEVVAVCDPSSEARQRFADRTGLRLPAFNDPDRLFAAVEVDAVAITSPNFTHKPITLAAARAGKHVYCEKAMANNVPDCWAMARAFEAAGLRLMVGHKRRLRPPWARMIELRDRLRPVVAVTACLYYDARPYDHRGWWTRAAQCGGLLDVAGIHTIDWTRALCGDVARVRAVAGPQSEPRYDFPDTLHVTLEFHAGAVASLSVSPAYSLLKFRESGGPIVVCREGGMRFVPYVDHIDLYWQHRDDSAPHHERFDDLGFDHAYRKEVGDFVRWVTEGAEPCLTWREGLRCVEVIEAAHRSAAANGACMELDIFGNSKMTVW